MLKKSNMQEAHEDEIYRTGVIAQFNLCFELAWKALRAVMVQHSVPNAETGSPRETLKLAFKIGFIDDEDVWLMMLQTRNLVTHVYSEDDADSAIRLIESKFIPTLERLKGTLEEKMVNDAAGMLAR